MSAIQNSAIEGQSENHSSLHILFEILALEKRNNRRPLANICRALERNQDILPQDNVPLCRRVPVSFHVEHVPSVCQ